jgi:hypothetical protein
MKWLMRDYCSVEHHIVDKVAWHTQQLGARENPVKTRARFRAFVEFLQKHKLTLKPLLGDDQDLTDDFEIRTDQLTDKGIKFVGEIYDKWLGKLDKDTSPEIVAKTLPFLDKQYKTMFG